MSSPISLALLTLLLWSSGGVFAKTMNISGNAALYIVTIFSALITFEISSHLTSRKSALPEVKILFSKKALISSFGFGAYWLCLGLSIEKAFSASVPMAIQYSWPIFTAIFFNAFFIERKNTIGIFYSGLGMVAGFSGVALLYLGSTNNPLSLSDFSLLSSLLALMAAIFLGFYSAYSSTIKTESHLSFMVLSCLSGCIVLLPWLILKPDSIYSITWPLFITAVLYGIAVEAFGTFLWTKANMIVRENNLNITKITSLMLFLPFISAMFLFLIYGEKDFLQVRFLTGLLLLVIGTALCNRASPK